MSMTKETKERAYGIIPPNQNLQRRIGGPLKPLEDKLIESVTIALQELTEDMADWLKTDVERLLAARNAFLDNSRSSECIETLHRAAHDLKGLGQTYGFPVVSQIADTLCKAILHATESGTIPEDIVNAHVDALRAVVNLNLREADSGPVTALLRGLDKIVKKQIA